MNIDKFKIGDRIRLVFTDDEYTELRPGDRGTIESINPVSIGIAWDKGSNLSMLPDTEDLIEVVNDDK